MKYLLIAAALSLGFGSSTCLAGTLHANHQVHGSTLVKAQPNGHRQISNTAAKKDARQNEMGG
jgi:hypothetical protein